MLLVYNGAGTEVTPNFDVPDQLRSSKTHIGKRLVIPIILWQVLDGLRIPAYGQSLSIL